MRNHFKKSMVSSFKILLLSKIIKKKVRKKIYKNLEYEFGEEDH